MNVCNPTLILIGTIYLLMSRNLKTTKQVLRLVRKVKQDTQNKRHTRWHWLWIRVNP
jgi:hypothetical protein